MTCAQVWNKCMEIYAKSYDLLSGAHGNVQVCVCVSLNPKP
jgi:hypothetical protein